MTMITQEGFAYRTFDQLRLYNTTEALIHDDHIEWTLDTDQMTFQILDYRQQVHTIISNTEHTPEDTYAWLDSAYSHLKTDYTFTSNVDEHGKERSTLILKDAEIDRTDAEDPIWQVLVIGLMDTESLNYDPNPKYFFKGRDQITTLTDRTGNPYFLIW